MVHQASLPEQSPHPRRVERVRHPGRRRARVEPWARILFVSPPLVMLLFLVTLVVPLDVTVAGVQLNPNTCLLLVFTAPAFLYWLQHQPRVIGLDVFMLLYIFWVAVAIYHTHGMSRIVYIINQSVTMLGSYMLGRVLVRNADDYRRMFTILFWILLFLLPFALVELVLKINVLGKIFGLPMSSGSGPGGIRLGLRRVTSVFPHPILFGVFCSVMVSNFFYVFYDHTGTRLRRTLLAFTMTFVSLSTGPNLAQLGQLILMSWERLFRFFVTKWYVLVVTAVTVLSIGQLSYPGGLYALLVEHLSFSEHTGWGRLEILVYGSESVLKHPLYGVGLTGWDGPWWRPASVDNFWMVTAMRYGIPALAFIWAGLAWHAVRIIGRGGLTERATNCRRGYVFAAAGIIFALFAVHMWAAVAVFIMFYFGAGAWLYVGDAALAPVGPRERPRRQPLVAGPAAAPAAPAPQSGRSGRAASRRTSARQDLHR